MTQPESVLPRSNGPRVIDALDNSAASGFAPLGGVRVLDLSRVLAGPFCTAMLADLGAEIIKLETPGHGDDSRSLGPFRDGESVYFALLNREKKSITLNLRDPEGLAVFNDLIKQCDVLVENFRPGVTERLGISYADLAEANPGLIYVSISGFGQDGPLAGRPAYDLVVQAASGLMSITGTPDGPPTRVGDSLGDTCSGIFAAWALSAALFDRTRTGKGTHIDVSMFESLLALQVTAISQLQTTGVAPGRVGNRHPISTPFDTYQARDGLVVLAAANSRVFERLSELIGRPKLPEDPRFRTDDLRTVNEPELRALIEEWTMQHDVDSIVALAGDIGVPASPVWDLSQALTSTQAAHRAVTSDVDHPAVGPLTVLQQPVLFQGRRGVAPTPSPELGAHNNEVFSELAGLSDERIAELREGKVI